MRRFFIFTKALFLLHLRNRMILFWNIAFPILLLFLYGFAFNNGTVDNSTFMTWVTPGVMVVNALSFGLITSSSMMMNLRENGVLRRLQATPMPAAHLVLSYLVVNVVLVLLQSVCIVITAVLLFDAALSLAGVSLALPMMLVGIITFTAMGQVINSIVPTAAVANMVGQIVYFVLMFLTDMVIPLETLPGRVAEFAAYMPSYAVVQLVRSPLLGGEMATEMGQYITITAVYTLVALLLAARFFRWEPRG